MMSLTKCYCVTKCYWILYDVLDEMLLYDVLDEMVLYDILDEMVDEMLLVTV